MTESTDTILESVINGLELQERKISVEELATKHESTIFKCCQVLNQWKETRETNGFFDKKSFKFYYLLRGLINSTGQFIVTVVEKNALDYFISTLQNPSVMLWAIQPQNVKEYIEDHISDSVCNLRLSPKKRDLKSVVTEPITKIEDKPRENKNKLIAITQDQLNQTLEKPIKTIDKAAEKNATNGELRKKSDNPVNKNQVPKGGIAAFFNNNKSSTNSANKLKNEVVNNKPPTTPCDKKKIEAIKSPPKTMSPKKVDKTKKSVEKPNSSMKHRLDDSSSDEDVIPDTPDEGTKRKKFKTDDKPVDKKKTTGNQSKKCLRIIDTDSSDEDLPLAKPSIEQLDHAKENINNSQKNKTTIESITTNNNNALPTMKKKEMVTETMMDENGYIVTRKKEVIIEVAIDANELQKEVAKKPGNNTKTSTAVKQKQSSITSFFSKK